MCLFETEDAEEVFARQDMIHSQCHTFYARNDCSQFEQLAKT